MMTHVAPTRAVRLTTLFAIIVLTLTLPTAALGHAELDTSDPAEGATVEAPFTGPITMTFTEDLANESSADLVDSAGKLPGTSAVDGKAMTLTPDTALAEGDYEVRWTSVADDGHIERGVVHFSVSPEPTSQPTAVPTPTPSGTATATPAATATASPTATPSAAASAAASASPSSSAGVPPSAGPSVAPLPTAGSDGGNTSSGGDVILPIMAAVVIIGGLAAILLRRRESSSSGS